MLVELLAGAAFGFLGGLMTAWRIAAKGAALAWLDDLRDVVKVRKTDRRKKQAVRHAKLDQRVAADALAKEAERKRVRRAHSELKKALPVANEAVRTYTSSGLIRTMSYFPDMASRHDIDTERAKLVQHLVVIDQLKGQIELLSGLGVKIVCPIADWSRAQGSELRTLAEKIDKATKEYALKL
ncbi:hypothetical protein [Streptomyces cyaneofuscatus]|uniref:hypothetical protein n=1 Tax=Streptomyces cyaneofuscatus TaxID=66883 RepID=UPI0036A26D18